MSILLWRGPAVLVGLIGVTLLSQNASAQPKCLPGQIESRGRCQAPAWICVSRDPQGKWVYCGPVLRHPAGPIQAANFRLAIAF